MGTNKSSIVRFLLVAGEFFLLALLVLLPSLFVTVDVVIMAHKLPEISATEIMQEFLLFISMLLFLKAAYRQTAYRGFNLLTGGFFAACLFGNWMDCWIMCFTVSGYSRLL